MKSPVSIAILVLAFSLVGCGVEKQRCERISAFAASAESAQLLEGLPHPLFEKRLFRREEREARKVEVKGFPFYAGARQIAAADARRIFAAFSVATPIREFEHEKKCGGFHPDFAVTFARGSRSVVALICFNCREISFSGDLGEIRTDADDRLIEVLQATLSKYQVQRPHE